MRTKCQRADFGVYFPTWGGFQEIVLHQMKNEMFCSPCHSCLVCRQTGCLPPRCPAFQYRKDHGKMVSWYLRYLGRGPPKSQMSSRSQWTATLVPKHCRQQQSLGVWESKLLGGLGARHGVHCLTAGLPRIVREKSLGNWWAAYSAWSSLWHLENQRHPNPWYLLGGPEQK